MNHMVIIILTALFCGLTFLSCSVKVSEPVVEQIFDSRLNQFKQKIGYDEAIKNEKRDGLIDIDFRKLKGPEFATKWPADKGWNFRKDNYRGEHYYYSWGVDGIGSDAVVTARICVNYEVARDWFIVMAENTTMKEIPWAACSKNVGTVCAGSRNRKRLFFVYKNVAVEINRDDALPGHEDFGEILAEWLFDALKAAPLKPFP